MDKNELLLEYLKLIAQMQSKGIEMLENSQYLSLPELVNDVLKNLGATKKQTKQPICIFANVDREGVAFQIDEETFFPLYSDEEENYDDED